MTRDLSKIANKTFDLLIIGGGINGAAIANIASGRGIKVCLLEKGDFASGTSSKSTKLVHGGIRYLENFEFDLVKESLHERSIQLKSVPHLVKPLKFLIPVYKGDQRPLWMMKIGVGLYDALAGKYGIEPHRNLSRDELIAMEPALKREGLNGGVSYFDAQMDDARLCLENVLSAAGKGAQTANYCEIQTFLKKNGTTIGVEVFDAISKTKFQVFAQKIICTVGPWTNMLLRLDDPSAKKRIRTTKGIHILYNAQLTKQAVLITSKCDNRVFFVVPWMGHSLIGTTDTDNVDRPDNLTADQNDIDYLLKEASRVFPDVSFSQDDIITTFAGLRPLIRQGVDAPSKVTRKHTIFQTLSGIHFIIGGKYTTYRRIALDCLNSLQFKNKPHSDENNYPLYGSGPMPESSEEIAKRYHIEIDSAKAILDKYGSKYLDVLKLIDRDPSLREKICSCSPFIKAQVHYAIQREMAQTPSDIIERRLSLIFFACPSKACQSYIQSLFP